MKAIYSPRQIQVATFFGGPLAAAYFLKTGFESIGKQSMAQKSFITTLIFSVILILAIPFIPENVPNNSVTLLYFIPIALLVKNHYLSKEEIAESEEYQFESNWKVFGFSLAFVAVFLALAIGVITAFESDDDIAIQITENINKADIQLNPSLTELKAVKDPNGSGVILNFKIHADALNDYRAVDKATLRNLVIQFFGKDAYRKLAEKNIYFITNFNSPSGDLIKKVIVSPSNIESP